jgi:phosphoglycerol transferase MdoB-like AlkP superfamily enzyme
MTNDQNTAKASWKQSRHGVFALSLALLLAGLTVLRAVLFAAFGPAGISAGMLARTFLIGLHQDLLVSLLVLLPLLFWLWIVPNRWFEMLWHRIFFIASFCIFWAVAIFLWCTEYFFFDEFRSRFNTVAVDYLMYPSEVFGNIRDSYPINTIISICVIASFGLTLVTFWIFRDTWKQPAPANRRFLFFSAVVALCIALMPTVSLQGTRFSEDRTLNEIANNGSISFVDAAVSRNLDYEAYYRTIPREAAYARARKILASPRAEFVGDHFSIRRRIAGDAQRPKLNVILFLEESLGSEFWGSLGRTNGTCTPEMDKLALEEGMFFTNMYACGNRTVRGFEGILSSFPPLPGDSIVKRDRSENVESLARVLKRDGYETLFVYGGRGLFDGMRSYALDNGWDRFIEQKDFKSPTFTTIWGVCDEDIFRRALEEFRKMAATGRPFLGTILSVSNHKPYTYPRGRIPEDPDLPKRARDKAVKYSDWCLGQFFKAAKNESFWTNTIFIVVADHGARLYGRQQIPIHSYEIPCVILGPAVVKEPQRIGTLANSLDVAPTILGLLGRPYETMFFGRDLLNDPPEGARAVLNHNREIGLFEHDRMVVMGLKKAVKFYSGDPKIAELEMVAEPSGEFLNLETNAISIYQVADELYMNRRYRIDASPRTSPSKQAETIVKQ